MPPTEYAVLDGGPRDGTVVTIGDTVTEWYRTYGSTPTRPLVTMTGHQLTRAALYRLVRRGVDGEPSRDDQGRLRYRYTCQEAA